MKVFHSLHNRYYDDDNYLGEVVVDSRRLGAVSFARTGRTTSLTWYRTVEVVA